LIAFVIYYFHIIRLSFSVNHFAGKPNDAKSFTKVLLFSEITSEYKNKLRIDIQTIGEDFMLFDKVNMSPEFAQPYKKEDRGK
jgi:hypothetical protein